MRILNRRNAGLHCGDSRQAHLDRPGLCLRRRRTMAPRLLSPDPAVWLTVRRDLNVGLRQFIPRGCASPQPVLFSQNTRLGHQLLKTTSVDRSCGFRGLRLD